MARGWSLSVLTLLVILSAPSPSLAQDDLAILPIEIAVATQGGAPVRDDAWIDGQIASAEQLFGPQGVHFRRVGSRVLDEAAARVETRADRDRLVAACRPRVINVFVVGTLKDVDEDGRMRFGVHWHNRSDPSLHYIILSSAAPKAVLAHELGHYLGNAHSTVPDNLMSYVRTPGADVFLDATQARVTRTKVRALIATGEIVALSPGKADAASP